MQETYTLDTSERDLVRHAMHSGVRAPFAALKTSIDFMLRDLDSNDPHRSIMVGALDEIARLRRSVETLYSFALAAELEPLSCSVEEVCRSAMRLLPQDETQRVWLALDESDDSMFTDAPLLADCIAHFLEDAIQRGSEEILFHAHQDQGVTYFAIVDDFSMPDDIDLDELEHVARPTDQPDSMALRVAARDIERMGGSITTTNSNLNQNCVIIRFVQEGGPSK